MWLVGAWLSLAHTRYLWGAVCNQLADLPCGCNFLAKHSLCFSQGPTLSQVTGLPAVVASCFLTCRCTFQWEADHNKCWRLFFWALQMEGMFWNPAASASLQQEAQSEALPGREGGSGECGRKTKEKGEPECWQERKVGFHSLHLHKLLFLFMLPSSPGSSAFVPLFLAETLRGSSSA